MDAFFSFFGSTVSVFRRRCHDGVSTACCVSWSKSAPYLPFSCVPFCKRRGNRCFIPFTSALLLHDDCFRALLKHHPSRGCLGHSGRFVRWPLFLRSIYLNLLFFRVGIVFFALCRARRQRHNFGVFEPNYWYASPCVGSFCSNHTGALSACYQLLMRLPSHCAFLGRSRFVVSRFFFRFFFVKFYFIFIVSCLLLICFSAALLSC